MTRLRPSVVAAFDRGKILGIRAGDDGHRFIGVWPVVVEGRLFVRSWGRKAAGWNARLRAAGEGAIQVGARTMRVRAVRTRSERLLAAIDAEYRRKYDTPGSRHYVRDMCRPGCRATTVELVPLGRTTRPAARAGRAARHPAGS